MIDVLFELFDMPLPRHQKCLSLYKLAARVERGVIVELGAYLGNGAIALALGAGEGTHVWTVDDYVEKRGWAGEPYLASDRWQLMRNLKAAGVEDRVTLVLQDAQVAALQWTKPVDLLVWDLGVASRALRDFKRWAPHVTPGGVYAVHDTVQGHLGAEGVARASGWEDRGIWPGGLRVLVKP